MEEPWRRPSLVVPRPGPWEVCPPTPRPAYCFLLQATPFHLARAQQPVLPESAPGHVLLEAAAQRAVLPLRGIGGRWSRVLVGQKAPPGTWSRKFCSDPQLWVSPWAEWSSHLVFAHLPGDLISHHGM